MLIKHTLSNGTGEGALTDRLDPEMLYEYIMHGGGLLIRAERKEFSLCLPLASCIVRDLPPVEASLDLRMDRVPRSIVTEILAHAITAVDKDGRLVESLFHLLWHPEERSWELIVPEQVRERSSVYPVHYEQGSSYQRAIVEVHSHHELTYGPNFSPTDDEEEKLFRIYAVLGDITKGAGLRTRISVFQQFIEVPSALIFDLPPEIRDCVGEEQALLDEFALVGENEEEAALAAAAATHRR
jgi:hypothetical protein